jgi:2-succinyl-5-enolpyruvyl-6-hydroxy-3-cyclohexene-1-carboxylate synthase
VRALPRDSVAAAPNRNLAFAGALFEELVGGGVRHVAVCPGSRSAPLALAAARATGLVLSTHHDERSAAFFALGLAKASRAPVAIVCTSGTAAANLLPAAVEAFHARVPLVLLTADRPPELRGVGAPQTIDQGRLFGASVRFFAEAALPEPDAASIRHARVLACRALAAACGETLGPVHLNLPFREPLDARTVAADACETDLATAGRAPEPYTRVRQASPEPDADALAFVESLVREHARGVVAVGPLDLDEESAAAIAAFAERAGWPLLADPAAQLRAGPPAASAACIAHADWILRSEAFAAEHAADVVLRVGPIPTSKAFRLWLERRPPRHLAVIDPGTHWEDPSLLASDLLRVAPGRLAERLLCRSALRTPLRPDSAWLAAWRDADTAASRVIAAARDRASVPTTPALVASLADALPDGALLYVANSMAIRDLDAFWPRGPRRVRVLANRGANGIDGLVSSALGAAAAHGGPTVLLTGDLAFLHDVGALAAARRLGVSLTIVVVNDDGGGIFSFLPVAGSEDPARFDALFRVPHGQDLARIAAGFGAMAVRADDRAGLGDALRAAIAAPGVAVVEVPLDRASDVALRRSIEREIGALLARARNAA